MKPTLERLYKLCEELSDQNIQNLTIVVESMVVAQGNPPETLRVEKSVEDKREGREKARV